MKKLFILIITLLLFFNSFNFIVNSDINKDESIQKDTIKNEYLYLKNVNNYNFLKYYSMDIFDLLKSEIYTICNGFEKTSETFFAISNDINVDGDENTGINGNDIRLQYIILPWFEMESELSIGLKFLFNVERIGDEIKNNNFNLTASIGNDIISIGYSSPGISGNEIPKKISFSIIVFINTVSSVKGLNFNIDPIYESSNEGKELILFGKTYDSEDDIFREYYFSFNSPAESDIIIKSTGIKGEWNYNFIRNTNLNTDFSYRFIEIENGVEKDTILTFYSFPNDISFNLLLTPFSSGGGGFKYYSNSIYNSKIKIQSNSLGICEYAIINKIPKKIIAEWNPIRLNGYYHLEIDSDGTCISLLDKLINPSINLTLNRVSDLNMTAYWNFSNPGDFRILKEPSLNIDILVIIDVWEFILNSQPIAEDIKISWLTDISGYLSYDTNFQPLNQMYLSIKGSDIGIKTVAEVFKAEDFQLDWTIWPPIEFDIGKSGDIEYISLLIEIFLEGNWHRLWPW